MTLWPCCQGTQFSGNSPVVLQANSSTDCQVPDSTATDKTHSAFTVYLSQWRSNDPGYSIYCQLC